jgi:hypothetical protein
MSSKLKQTKNADKKAPPSNPFAFNIPPSSPSNLPEQERFTVEEVAARWNKSKSYVTDLMRRELLPYCGTITKVPGTNTILTKLFVARQDLEQFERACHEQPPFLTIQEMALKNRCSEKTVRRWIKARDVRAIKGPNNRWQIYP